MLSKTTLADLRTTLENERGNLSARLAELDEGSPSALSFDHNFADTSQVTAERSEMEALVKSLRESHDEVVDALAKLEAGTYGTCERCGGQIAPARLEAKPAARLCIECASTERSSL